MIVSKLRQIVKSTKTFIAAWPYLYRDIMSSEERCIFCKICHHTVEAAILHEEDDYMVFRDIKPAAKHHYLVIPKAHIKGANFMTKSDLPMLNKMEQLARQVLQEQGADMCDIRLGFHWPPFNSINHLHLHVISPASEMGLIQRHVFKPDTFWFASLDYMYDRLNKEC